MHSPVPLPWAQDNKTQNVQDLEKAIYKVFSSPEGNILWNHLQRTVLDTALAGNDSKEYLHHMNGKRSLVLHLRNLANRGKNI